jgi:hypothetical protein
MPAQKTGKVSLGPDFPAGKFRVPVQFPAQRYRQIQKPFVQARSPLLAVSETFPGKAALNF